MNAARYIVLAVAAAAAVGLAVVVRGVVGGQPEAKAAAAVERPEPTVRVLVAARDLKVGERLSEAEMTWQPWPARAINPSFVVDGEPPAGLETLAAAAEKARAAEADAETPKAEEKSDAAAKAVAAARDLLKGPQAKRAFVDAIVREAVLAGEPIQDRKLVRAGESGFMAVVLRPGMRAMAVPVRVQTAAGGFILPGDRVDVIVSKKIPARQEGEIDRMASRTVLQNLRVLAVDQTTQPADDAQAVVGATATLEIAAKDAEALALAASEGDLSLALRSYADADQPSGALGAVFDPAASRPAVAVATAPAGTVAVRLFRGGEATDVQVSR